MSFDLQRIYELLPVVHRLRDIETASRMLGVLDEEERADLQSLLARLSSLTAAETDRLIGLQQKAEIGPLKALLSIISDQVAVLEENLAQLYDDLFIETCAEWVVPYIGDLAGVRGVLPFPGATFTRRAEVANAIAARRRKGTAYMLEQLARDVSRWDSHVVEYFQILATTQFMNHLRPFNRTFTDLRFPTLALINTPFDTVPRTVDVRNIASGAGRYNIPNVGIWLWRIRSYPITNAEAFRVDGQRWKFDPLGRDVQLYNRRDDRVPLDDFAQPVNVPAPITRALASRRPETYDPASFSFRLIVDGQEEDFVICDLRDHNAGWAHQAQGKHAIDPELGRIALLQPANEVFVTYRYGFSADMGGGEYTRPEEPAKKSTQLYLVPTTEFPTINSALLAMRGEWDLGAEFDRGVIELTGNITYSEMLTVDIPKSKDVVIRAAAAHRPVVSLQGALEVTGDENSEFHVDGLLMVTNGIRVPRFTVTGATNGLEVVRIAHCTLLEPVTIDADTVELTVDHSIVTSLHVTDDAETKIENSIVDAGDETNEAYRGIASGEAGAPLTIVNSTVIGTVYTRILTVASNTIFVASSTGTPPVQAVQVQKGCVRFSYVPPGSRVPRRFQCQPKRAGMRPMFTSLRLGDAGYAQLARNCAIEIRTGADDQSEMGAFHDLMQPQREANLRARLDEFLRFGLEAGIFFAS